MIIELIREKHISVYLNYFKMKRKKFRNTRYVYGFLFFLIYSMGILLMKQQVYLIGSPVAFYIGYKIPYLNLILHKKVTDLKVSFLFPQFLQSFMALLPTSGNVYQTLLSSVPYTSEPLKAELEKLVDKITIENKREDYLSFAEFIGTGEAYMILDMIYQFSEFGVRKEAIEELQSFIQSLQENKISELIRKKLVAAEKFGLTPIMISLYMVFGYVGVIGWYYLRDVMDALNGIF